MKIAYSVLFFFCEQTAFNENMNLSLKGEKITEARKDRKIRNTSVPQSQPAMDNISTITKMNNLKHNYSVLSGKHEWEYGKFRILRF